MLEKLVHKLQTIFKVTKAEIYVAFLILIGTLVGLATIQYQNPKTKEILLNAALFDSLALYEKTAELERKEYNQNYFENLTARNNSEMDTNSNPAAEKTAKPRKLKVGFDEKQINLNSASKAELMQLPGIGDKTADKVIEYRNNKKFLSPSDIQKVKGIGPAKFEKMKPYIIVK